MFILNLKFLGGLYQLGKEGFHVARSYRYKVGLNLPTAEARRIRGKRIILIGYKETETPRCIGIVPTTARLTIRLKISIKLYRFNLIAL